MAHYLTTILTLLISLLFFSAAIAQTPSSTSTAATTSFTGMPTIVANGGGDRYGYVGCYNETAGLPDTSGARTLSGGGKTFDGIMTVQMCVEYCSKNGNFPFAGVEYSRECWCGHRLSGLATKVADEECDTPVRLSSSYFPARVFLE